MMVNLAEIDELIEFHQKHIRALLELKNLWVKENRNILVDHEAHKWSAPKKLHGKVTKVMCTCGHETRYKIPLNNIDEFSCPKA